MFFHLGFYKAQELADDSPEFFVILMLHVTYQDIMFSCYFRSAYPIFIFPRCSSLN